MLPSLDLSVPKLQAVEGILTISAQLFGSIQCYELGPDEWRDSPTAKGVPTRQMMAGTNIMPMGTYQMFGLVDLASP